MVSIGWNRDKTRGVVQKSRARLRIKGYPIDRRKRLLASSRPRLLEIPFY